MELHKHIEYIKEWKSFALRDAGFEVIEMNHKGTQLT